MKREIEELEAKRVRQWYYFELADNEFKLWLNKNNYDIFRVEYIAHFGEYAEVLIFFKTNTQLKEFKNNKITTLIETEFIKILKRIGYINEFNKKILIYFDSHENVIKYYNGNYGLRINDGGGGVE